MIVDIGILDWASVSPLGNTPDEIWQAYLLPKHCISLVNDNLVAGLQEPTSKALEILAAENHKYKALDPTVLMSILTARQLNAERISKNCGINLGSSRGATTLFEAFYQEFQETGKTSPQSSPATTLGNLSSWVAQDLGLNGIALSHSITCSTALHALVNACAWIKAGFSETFIAGGSEAPLTPFTIAQMQAMRIYADDHTCEYPCRAFDFSKPTNTMVLGQGCGMFLLDKNLNQAKFKIRSIGYATEAITHGSSISADGESMQKAMLMALEGIESKEIDAVVMHAPGTKKGDDAEFKAIKNVFGNELPLLTTNKWKIGHTLGASGALSVEFALLMLQHQTFVGLPWEANFVKPISLKTILVNAVGFGGNAVSVSLERL